MKFCSCSNRSSNKITIPSLELTTSILEVDGDMLPPSFFLRKFNSTQVPFEEFFVVNVFVTIPRLTNQKCENKNYTVKITEKSYLKTQHLQKYKIEKIANVWLIVFYYT